MFDKVFIGELELKNRFVRSATWEGLCIDGFINGKTLKIYEELAKNNIGLLITGFATVSEFGNSNNWQMAIYDDKFCSGLKELTNIVHANNSKIAIQLVHCGGQARLPKAPSSVDLPFYKKIPEELTLSEIIFIEDDFKKAAERAVEVGFDAIQIHAAHGYLISQFLSPASNKRYDKYGGNIDGRMKILTEIYQKIRETVGKDYPVLIKINCSDFIENGLEFKDTLYILKVLEKVGLDGVEISGGVRGGARTPIITNIDSIEKEGYWKDYAKELKKHLQIPVILVGGLRSYEFVEELYKKGFADFFSFSRPLIKEPDLIKKWHDKIFEKSKCKSCNKCFIPAYKGEGIKCFT